MVLERGVEDQLDQHCEKEVLHRVKEEKKFLNTRKRRKVNWIRDILCRYSVLRNSFEGKIEGMIGMTEKRGRRRKQLRNGLKKTRGCWKLKERHSIALCA